MRNSCTGGRCSVSFVVSFAYVQPFVTVRCHPREWPWTCSAATVISMSYRSSLISGPRQTSPVLTSASQAVRVDQRDPGPKPRTTHRPVLRLLIRPAEVPSRPAPAGPAEPQSPADRRPRRSRCQHKPSAPAAPEPAVTGHPHEDAGAGPGRTAPARHQQPRPAAARSRHGPGRRIWHEPDDGK